MSTDLQRYLGVCGGLLSVVVESGEEIKLIQSGKDWAVLLKLLPPVLGPPPSQVFQKCPVGGRQVEPQVRELRAGVSPALKETKVKMMCHHVADQLTACPR